MGNNECRYQMCTIEEYLSAIEETKNDEKVIVAKSLIKYLKNRKLAA